MTHAEERLAGQLRGLPHSIGPELLAELVVPVDVEVTYFLCLNSTRGTRWSDLPRKKVVLRYFVEQWWERKQPWPRLPWQDEFLLRALGTLETTCSIGASDGAHPTLPTVQRRDGTLDEPVVLTCGNLRTAPG